jgi:hypothetical protein
MHGHGHTTVWGTHLGIARARHAKSWCQQLQDWWTAHKGARRAVNLATVSVCGDATREVVAPFGAEAAPEMAAAQHTLAVGTMLYGLS